MSSRKSRRALAGALAFGALAAWSQAPSLATTIPSDTVAPDDTAAAATDPATADVADVPPQFADGSVTIALVAQLSAGDYFEQWRAGAEAQAEELGITLDFLGADGDSDRHALNVQQAIDSEADAIIIDHGFPETIQPVVGRGRRGRHPGRGLRRRPRRSFGRDHEPERRGDRRQRARGARGRHRR